jgi:hypothetical protein
VEAVENLLPRRLGFPPCENREGWGSGILLITTVIFTSRGTGRKNYD